MKPGYYGNRYQSAMRKTASRAEGQTDEWMDRRRTGQTARLSRVSIAQNCMIDGRRNGWTDKQTVVWTGGWTSRVEGQTDGGMDGSIDMGQLCKKLHDKWMDRQTDGRMDGLINRLLNR